MRYLVLLFLAMFLFSCAQNSRVEKDVVVEGQVPTEVTSVKKKVKKNRSLIADYSFFDIKVGDKIPSEEYLKAGAISTENGSTKVVFILHDDASELAYIIPDSTDPTMVGEIVIISPKVFSINGLRIGDTYGELLTTIEVFELKGSSEGSTYVYAGNTRYKLNISNKTIDVDPLTVPKNAEIVGFSLIQ